MKTAFKAVFAIALVLGLVSTVAFFYHLHRVAARSCHA